MHVKAMVMQLFSPSTDKEHNKRFYRSLYILNLTILICCCVVKFFVALNRSNFIILVLFPSYSFRFFSKALFTLTLSRVDDFAPLYLP